MKDQSAEALERPLRERLERLEITTTTHRHPPLRTVEESKALRGELPGVHIKNLFLRDKKRNLWLVVTQEDRDLDLKALKGHLEGCRGNLSFGSSELLREALGVDPGAVTPFAVLNDSSGRVRLVVDRSLLDQEDAINAHPLHNEATTAIAPKDLVRFLEDCDHPPRLIDLGGLSRSPQEG